jgi:glucosyl-dolichyl phosphate glucuronosyltransferase
MAAAASLSVVVCTWRRQGRLPGLLAALAAQTRAPLEVLLVDDEGSPETEALARSAGLPGLRYLRGAALGVSAARNRGIAEARGELVAFLDDDALPVPGWAAALLDGAAAHPAAGALAGPVELRFEAPPPDFLASLGTASAWLPSLDGGPADLLLVAERRYRGPLGANMAFRRAALQAAGHFDVRLGRTGEALGALSENAYVDRVRAAGHEVWYLAAARVHHLMPAERLTARWFLQRAYWEGVSRVRLLLVTGDAASAAGALPQRAADLVASLARGGAVAGRPLGERLELAAALGGVAESARLAGPQAAGAPALAELRRLAPAIEAELPGDWRAPLGL